MEKILSEVEIVTLLEKRIISIKSELHRTEKALTAIKGHGCNEGRIVEKNLKRSKKRTDPPLSYDVNLKWHEKILFILSKSGGTFKDDIFKELSSLEPKSDKNKLMNSLSVNLSLLYKQENIKAEKSGRKFKYYLLE